LSSRSVPCATVRPTNANVPGACHFLLRRHRSKRPDDSGSVYSGSKNKAPMSHEPRPTSERARKRTSGENLREALIKRRETYFDLLVSGSSIEQIASHTKTTAAVVRRAVGLALAKRRLDAPEDYARLQIARLTKALRCADVFAGRGRPAGDCAVPESRAGVDPLPRRQCWPRAAARPAAGSAACAHAFARNGCYGSVRGRKKLRESAAKLLKSFARVNLCVGGQSGVAGSP
jgi:hypothetical protein